MGYWRPRGPPHAKKGDRPSPIREEDGTAEKRLRAVLLDVDGTLIDSNDAHAEAWKQAGAAFGRSIPFHAARALIGMGGDKVLPRLTGLSKDSPEGKQLAERRTEIFRTCYLPKLKPFKGARQLLERLASSGVKLVVASSAGEDELKELLEQAGISDLITDTTSSHDADESKPAPDIVQIAIERAGVPVEECVMLGDTPYDVAAARRAGVRVIALRCGGWGDRDLAGAIEIYDGPADVLEHFETSVLGNSAPVVNGAKPRKTPARRVSDR
jgi:HAD superfamily hydrolase (TIGR01509 family)